MKKLILVFGIATSFAMASAASAADICHPVKRHVVHQHPAHHACAPKKVVVEKAPEKVVETPVVHDSVVVERTIIKHEIVELPARVIVVRPRPCCNAAPAPLPPRRSGLGCCPPGQNIPGLPPCRTLGSAAPQGRSTPSKWAQVSACMKGLGLNDDEFFSRQGSDGTDHVRLTGEAAARMRAAGMLQAVDECAARVKSSNIAYQ